MRLLGRMGVSGLPHGAAGSAAGQMNGTGFLGPAALRSGRFAESPCSEIGQTAALPYQAGTPPAGPRGCFCVLG